MSLVIVQVLHLNIPTNVLRINLRCIEDQNLQEIVQNP